MFRHRQRRSAPEMLLPYRISRFDIKDMTVNHPMVYQKLLSSRGKNTYLNDNLILKENRLKNHWNLQ